MHVIGFARYPRFSLPSSAATSQSRSLFFGLLLVAATLVVYAQAVNFDFVDYADDEYVTQNPHACHGLTWANFG